MEQKIIGWILSDFGL